MSSLLKKLSVSIKIHVVKQTQKQSQTQSVWPVSKLSIESVGSSRRELVVNSCTHLRRRRDATKQFRRVDGVYWALRAGKKHPHGFLFVSLLTIFKISSPPPITLLHIHH